MNEQMNELGSPDSHKYDFSYWALAIVVIVWSYY